MYVFFQILGILGAVLLLLAYFKISKGDLSSDSWRYHALNMQGSLLLVINTIYLKAYGVLILNAVWFMISVFHILKKIRIINSK